MIVFPDLLGDIELAEFNESDYSALGCVLDSTLAKHLKIDRLLCASFTKQPAYYPFIPICDPLHSPARSILWEDVCSCLPVPLHL